MMKTLAKSRSQMDSWFLECREKLQIKIEKIPAVQSKDWQITLTPEEKPAQIVHTSGRFHEITFLRSLEPLRNNMWIDRCMLEPVIEKENNTYGIILLAAFQGKYLVQAKGEPGHNTPGRVALTCTIQASHANICMALSGKTPFLEFVDMPNCKKYKVVQDGGHLLNKISQSCFVELEEMPKHIPYNFYWATLDEIREFASRTLVTEHLFQTLGLLGLLRL